MIPFIIHICLECFLLEVFIKELSPEPPSAQEELAAAQGWSGRVKSLQGATMWVRAVADAACMYFCGQWCP